MRKRSASEIKARIQRQSPAERYPVSAHHVFDYLNLVSVLGANPELVAPQLVVTDEEIKAVREKFGVVADELRPLCGLNPGAEYGPAKRWPAERFIAAAQQIHQRANCRWLMLGGKGDAAVASEIATGISRPTETKRARLQLPNNVVMNLAGTTSLRELCVLLKMCEILLTNDTGPMHVAAALGTPVVVPFGSTSPELTGPGLPGESRHTVLRADVSCAPCFRRECPIDFRCMHGISVQAVVDSVLRLIRR
jgi:heptosyltransferase-2